MSRKSTYRALLKNMKEIRSSNLELGKNMETIKQKMANGIEINQETFQIEEINDIKNNIQKIEELIDTKIIPAIEKDIRDEDDD